MYAVENHATLSQRASLSVLLFSAALDLSEAVSDG